MSSNNLQNFSFQIDSAKKIAQAPWTNRKIPRALRLEQLRLFNPVQLHNPYTREKWLELAAYISQTQLTAEQLQSMDFQSYRKLCQLLKEAMTVWQLEQRSLDEETAAQTTKFQQLREKQQKLQAESAKNKNAQLEFKLEIEKLQQKRKSLQQKYDQS